MSTVDHLLAECGRLRTAWGWLGEALIPGRARRNQRTLTPAAQASRNKQAATDRNNRADLLHDGALVTSSSAPLNVSAHDARERIAQQVDDTAWKVASHLRNRVQPPYRPGKPAYRPGTADTNSRFRAAVDWISTSAVRLNDGDQALINATYRSLADSTTLATAVAGAGPQRRPLAAECPACGRRSLAWDTSSERYEEWHVMCTSEKCRCQGRDCVCRIAGRQHGMTHLWTEASWERLAEQIASKESSQ